MDLESVIKEINKYPEGFRLKIKVTANAKKNSIEFNKDEDGMYSAKIKINKPAVDGKANKAIVEYLSDIFKTPKSNITFLSGEKSSQKCLLIKPKTIII